MEDLIEDLRKKGFQIACEPELLSNGARKRVLSGPCFFSGTLGSLLLRGVFVVVDYATSDVIRDLTVIRMKKGVPLAFVIARDPPPRELELLATALGVGIIHGELRAIVPERVEEYIVLPGIDAEVARKIFETRVKSSLSGILGGVLSSRKITFAGHRLVYIMIACYEVLVHMREHGELLEAQRSNLCFETASGSLVGVERGRIAIREEFSRLGELDHEAIRVLEIIASGGRVSLNEIAEHFGDPERARVIVDFLVELGLIEPDYEGYFHIVEPRIEDYTSLRDYFAGKGKLVQGKPAKCARIIEPGFDLTALDKVVKAFGLIEGKCIIYYPIYIGIFRKFRNHERYVDTAAIIDGLTGERLEDLEEVLVSSNAIYQLDRIIEEVTSQLEEKCIEDSEPARPHHSSQQELESS